MCEFDFGCIAKLSPMCNTNEFTCKRFYYIKNNNRFMVAHTKGQRRLWQ